MGRIVSPQQIAAQIGPLHDKTADRFAVLVKGYYDGQISIATLQLAMQSELKSIHTSMAALGVGGWSKATPALWGRTGADLKREYKYLARFMTAIENGKLSVKQAMERAKLYADNAYGQFWDEYTRTLANSGQQTEEILIPQPGACPQCLALAAKGWVKIGTVYVPVHNKCRCGKDYR